MLQVDNRGILHLLTHMDFLRHVASLLDSRRLPTRLHDGPTFMHIRPNSVWFKKSFLYQGIMRWNNLPSSLRSIEDAGRFKRKLNNILPEEEILLYPHL